MAYSNVAGRINTENLTAEEWRTLEVLSREERWIVPSDEIWLGMRNLLALVDIRRGWDAHPDGGIQLGVCQVRINQHGKEALRLQEQEGKFYTYDKKLTQQEIDRLVEME